jgi:single-stranded DNA-binding protein
MVDGLIAGKLYGTATERTGQSGKPFVVAKVRAAVGNSEAVFVNVVAFSDSVKAALLALSDGDSVALAGTLTPKAWMDRNGDAKPVLDVVAHALLTAYHVKRKREAVQASRQQAEPMNGGGADSVNDDL